MAKLDGALCSPDTTNEHPDLWFDHADRDKGRAPANPRARVLSLARVKAICAECPVRVECLNYALDHDDLVGIWGGTTTDERAELRRRSA